MSLTNKKSIDLTIPYCTSLVRILVLLIALLTAAALPSLIPAYLSKDPFERMDWYCTIPIGVPTLAIIWIYFFLAHRIACRKRLVQMILGIVFIYTFFFPLFAKQTHIPPSPFFGKFTFLWLGIPMGILFALVAWGTQVEEKNFSPEERRQRRLHSMRTQLKIIEGERKNRKTLPVTCFILFVLSTALWGSSLLKLYGIILPEPIPPTDAERANILFGTAIPALALGTCTLFLARSLRTGAWDRFWQRRGEKLSAKLAELEKAIPEQKV